MARKFEPTDLQQRVIGFCRDYLTSHGSEPGVAEVAVSCECTMHEAASTLRVLRHYGVALRNEVGASRRQGGA